MGRNASSQDVAVELDERHSNSIKSGVKFQEDGLSHCGEFL
jgi:hypothetical protein